MDKIENLKQQLDYHDDLYYNQDTPELSDAEYDALKQEYLNLTNQKEYNYVPGKAQFKKYTHTTSIKSLGKVKENELRKELERLAPGVIEVKLDGLTLVDYPDGAIVTRGNSLVGENIHDTASKIGLPKNTSVPVRMEAFITKQMFRELNKQREEQGLKLFKNPRNAAAGILRNKDLSKVKGVTYVTYNIIGSKDTEIEQLQKLSELGFNTVPYLEYGVDNIDKAMEFILNFDRTKLDFDIDGMVIKSNRPDALNYYGETEHHPLSACAFKWDVEGVWTHLLDVTWQVGRTGKVVPVAELEPVELMDSTIERATLHNIGYIEGLKLCINDEVYLIKANEVIPAIIDCRCGSDLIDIVAPTHCPSCGSKLRQKNMQLFCDNSDCQAKLLYRTSHMVSRDALNIEGLSEQTIAKMIEAGYIQKPWDIFDISEGQILRLDGFAKKSAKKIYENIQSARNCDFDRAIYASGIELVGRKVSKDIAKEFGTWNNLLPFLSIRSELIQRLSFIDGIGDAIIQSFIDNIDLLYELVSYLNIKQPEEKKEIIAINENPFKGKSVYPTGVFLLKKADLKIKLEEIGAIVEPGYKKSLDILICGGDMSRSGKGDRAEKDGVKMVSEEYLIQYLK